jgi:NAD-dependent SIR2 family protein deacetylase
MWRTHDATSLATPQAFERNPGLVWQFYSYRRHMALKAKPNPAHYALAELARKKENFITLSQNVDGEHYPQTIHCRIANTPTTRPITPRPAPRR